ATPPADMDARRSVSPELHIFRRPSSRERPRSEGHRTSDPLKRRLARAPSVIASPARLAHHRNKCKSYLRPMARRMWPLCLPNPVQPIAELSAHLSKRLLRGLLRMGGEFAISSSPPSP